MVDGTVSRVPWVFGMILELSCCSMNAINDGGQTPEQALVVSVKLKSSVHQGRNCALYLSCRLHSCVRPSVILAVVNQPLIDMRFAVFGVMGATGATK